MKICVRCKQLAQDNEPYCKRCGSNQFAAYNQQQQQQSLNQNIRPQQMQGQRPQQMNRSQMQGQVGQQNMSSMQNTFMSNQGQPQRPQQNNYIQPQQQIQNTNVTGGYTMDDFQDEPTVETKKKMFKSKADKKAEMYAQMNQMQVMKDGNQVNYNNIQTNNIQDTGVITFKDWIITMIFLVIPIWNIIYLVKSLNNPILNESKKNYLKAYLLYTIVATVISTVITCIFTILGVAVL